jgi:hypothetical protein
MPSSAMTTRERFQAVINFQPFDRLPLVEWAGWWTATIDRWVSEGFPAHLRDDGSAIRRWWGLDVYCQDWIRAKGPDCPKPTHHGAGLIADEKEYERIKPHLFPWPCVNRAMWQAWAEEQKRGDVVLWFTLEGFFWYARTLLGIEPHLYAFYDQPALMHRINRDLTDWSLRVVDEIFSICVPDFMTFAEDMSYNNGPMLSESLFDEFMLPYYHKLLPRIHERGTISIIDSDGDISVPAYWFERAGLQGILPLERQAGVDIARLRRDHPRMRFIGHYDKMVMNKGEAAIRGEFERLLPTARQGGFLISCDHQTPPGVSLKDYEIYVRLFREYAVRAAG